MLIVGSVEQLSLLRSLISENPKLVNAEDVVRQPLYFELANEPQLVTGYENTSTLGRDSWRPRHHAISP
jgi:hypothetical protein